MGELARFEPKVLSSEQESQQKADAQPWLRQKNEPAVWYMRFQRYLDMGTERSIRALVIAESGTQARTDEGKKLSDVSVPRPWRRASKTWDWVKRAEAYDLDQLAIQATGIRQIASSAPHASRPYRILKLDSLARLLLDKLINTNAQTERKAFLAYLARYQSVLRDIHDEMEGMDAATDSVDAAACRTVIKEAEQQLFEEKLKDAARHEQNRVKIERYEANERDSEQGNRI